MNIELTSMSDVLMPLAPGNDTEVYESVFVLPKEGATSDVATNDNEEQNQNGAASKKSRKRNKVQLNTKIWTFLESDFLILLNKNQT